MPHHIRRSLLADRLAASDSMLSRGNQRRVILNHRLWSSEGSGTATVFFVSVSNSNEHINRYAWATSYLSYSQTNVSQAQKRLYLFSSYCRFYSMDSLLYRFC